MARLRRGESEADFEKAMATRASLLTVPATIADNHEQLNSPKGCDGEKYAVRSRQGGWVLDCKPNPAEPR